MPMSASTRFLLACVIHSDRAELQEALTKFKRRRAAAFARTVATETARDDKVEEVNKLTWFYPIQGGGHHEQTIAYHRGVIPFSLMYCVCPSH